MLVIGTTKMTTERAADFSKRVLDDPLDDAKRAGCDGLEGRSGCRRTHAEGSTSMSWQDARPEELASLGERS